MIANRHAARERLAAAAEQRRDGALQLLGRVRRLLDDLSPAGIAMNINGSGDARLPDLIEQWDVLRDELAVLAEGHPDAQVREDARALSTETTNTLNRLGGVLYDQKTHSGMGREMYDAAVEHHAKARELLDRLSSTIRGTNAGCRSSSG